MRGENQKKSVATIDSKTFEIEIFNSLSDCSKKLEFLIIGEAIRQIKINRQK